MRKEKLRSHFLGLPGVALKDDARMWTPFASETVEVGDDIACLEARIVTCLSRSDLAWVAERL